MRHSSRGRLYSTRTDSAIDLDFYLQLDREQRVKEEKIRLAIQKIKQADIKKVSF